MITVEELFMSCCMDSCEKELYTHDVCFYHFWSEPCGHEFCSNSATHSWAAEETALLGDVCFFCDQHWQEFVAEEAAGGVFDGSLGAASRFMHHIHLREA
jgi:hypothetical protein